MTVLSAESVGFGSVAAVQQPVSKRGGSHLFRQKGQAIVEFAVVFPIFLFVFLTMIYLSLCLMDYFTIQEIARSSARDAALKGSKSYVTIHDNYIKAYKDEKWFTNGLYEWRTDENGGDFTIAKEENNTDMNKPVVVKIVLRRNDKVTGVSILDMVFTLPEKLEVEYRMYDEALSSTS